MRMAQDPAGRPRVRLLALTAAAALAAGAGTTWAGTTWAATAGGAAATALTTAQIVTRTDPAVVDVVATLGYQNARAGLAAGDSITSLGGHRITAPAQIRSVLTQYHPGDKISIIWTDQAARQHSATITLTAGPAG
jgi:S1-C subfamily serine protease